jgi:hypothetical protein
VPVKVDDCLWTTKTSYARSGVTRYRTVVADEFSADRQTLHDYYALEQRWADRPFWRRRHAGLAARRPDPTADLASPRAAHPSL